MVMFSLPRGVQLDERARTQHKIREALMNLNGKLVSANLYQGYKSEELNFVQINDTVVGVSAENGNVEAKARAIHTDACNACTIFLASLHLCRFVGLGIDTTAGEKERGSLSLCSSSSIQTSRAGKMLYLMLMSILTSVLNLVGLVIGLYLEMSFLGGANMPFSIELDAIDYLYCS